MVGEGLEVSGIQATSSELGDSAFKAENQNISQVAATGEPIAVLGSDGQKIGEVNVNPDEVIAQLTGSKQDHDADLAARKEGATAYLEHLMEKYGVPQEKREEFRTDLLAHSTEIVAQSTVEERARQWQEAFEAVASQTPEQLVGLILSGEMSRLSSVVIEEAMIRADESEVCAAIERNVKQALGEALLMSVRPLAAMRLAHSLNALVLSTGSRRSEHWNDVDYQAKLRDAAPPSPYIKAKSE